MKKFRKGEGHFLVPKDMLFCTNFLCITTEVTGERLRLYFIGETNFETMCVTDSYLNGKHWL